jgi:quinate dehydrogenase (quinone)
MTTKSGLTFHAGTQDYYLRAYNTETGDILWEGRLPSGAQSTPMTYFDKASGRQFVTVTAGGARYNSNDRDDWIIAYALPKGAT